LYVSQHWPRSIFDNFWTETYEPSKQIFIKTLDACPKLTPNGLLQYNDDDGGDSFQYKLANIDQIIWLS
jgi:hypothetical protein